MSFEGRFTKINLNIHWQQNSDRSQAISFKNTFSSTFLHLYLDSPSNLKKSQMQAKDRQAEINRKCRREVKCVSLSDQIGWFIFFPNHRKLCALAGLHLLRDCLQRCSFRQDWANTRDVKRRERRQISRSKRSIA